MWSFPTSTEQIHQASGSHHAIHDCQVTLMSFKDNAVHPKVQISINCQFELTITEQLQTHHRLLIFYALNIKT